MHLDHLFSDADSVCLGEQGRLCGGERYADDLMPTVWVPVGLWQVSTAPPWVWRLRRHFASVIKASTVLTEFVDTNKENITLEQILRMRSGLAADTDVLVVIKPRMHWPIRWLRRRIRFSYSNANSQLFERSCGGPREWMLMPT